MLVDKQIVVAQNASEHGNSIAPDVDQTALQVEVDRLKRILQEEERAHEQTLVQRDNYHDWADRLSHAIGGDEIGEHSSANNPWKNALEMTEFPPSNPPVPQALLDELREFVSAVVGENRPDRVWAVELRGRIDALPGNYPSRRAEPGKEGTKP